MSETTYTVQMTLEQINTAVKLFDAAVRAQGLVAASDALVLTKLFQDSVKPAEG